jgi:hypothetical protein
MKIKAILLLTSIQVFCTAIASDFSFSETMSPGNGKTTLDTRTFYFDRSFDTPGTPDSEALTMGGILKYASGRYRKSGFGLAYYGSYSLSGIVDRDKGGGTALLQADGDDISFLGEAYIDFDSGINQLKIGRQRLATPLMDDRDIRLLPTVYEAAVYRYRSQRDINYELGFVKSYSATGSSLSDFDDPVEDWGEDGLGYVFVSGNLGLVSARAQIIDTLENSGTFDNYGYLDANYPIAAGTGSYFSGQIGHTGYQQGESSRMYGLKAGTSINKVDVAVLFNVIRDNRFRTVQAGPLYSDWQQGYGNYEPSDSIGIQATFYPVENTSIKLGYVKLDSKDGDEFNLDSYGEFNLDAQYTFNDASKIRLRYSDKNQDDDSGREDRNDFRIIYYYNFP